MRCPVPLRVLVPCCVLEAVPQVIVGLRRQLRREGRLIILDLLGRDVPGVARCVICKVKIILEFGLLYVFE